MTTPGWRVARTPRGGLGERVALVEGLASVDRNERRACRRRRSASTYERRPTSSQRARARAARRWTPWRSRPSRRVEVEDDVVGVLAACRRASTTRSCRCSASAPSTAALRVSRRAGNRPRVAPPSCGRCRKCALSGSTTGMPFGACFWKNAAARDALAAALHRERRWRRRGRRQQRSAEVRDGPQVSSTCGQTGGHRARRQPEPVSTRPLGDLQLDVTAEGGTARDNRRGAELHRRSSSGSEAVTADCLTIEGSARSLAASRNAHGVLTASVARARTRRGSCSERIGVGRASGDDRRAPRAARRGEHGAFGANSRGHAELGVVGRRRIDAA